MSDGAARIPDIIARAPPAPSPDDVNARLAARDEAKALTEQAVSGKPRKLRHAKSGAAAEAPGSGAERIQSVPPPTARSSEGNGRAGGAPPPPAHGGDGNGDGLNLRLAFYRQSDLGNGERFRERYRGKLLWASEIPFWWDGQRYSPERAEDQARMAAHRTVRAIQDEAKALLDSGRDIQVDTKFKGRRDEKAIMMSDELAKFGREFEQTNRLAAALKEGKPYLSIAREQLDADPFKFNVANGTLCLGKRFDGYVDFKPHNPVDLITKLSPVCYDPAATSPLFDQFFAHVQPEESYRRLLMQWFGLSLTGDTREQKICILWGEGSNGKSTLVEICAHIAGEYSQSIPVETFLDDGRHGRSPGQASPDLARLPGVRLLRTSEPRRGAKLADAQIKLATGGEPITARHLNEEFFEFAPEFKLTISGNYRLRLGGGDHGIRRRVIFVPWRVQIPQEQRDTDLKQKLLAEAPGILNRLLDGLRDWFDHGLLLPAGVVAATSDYHADSDPAGEFLKECVAEALGERVKASRMHAVFKAWAKANASEEWSEKGLSGALKDKGMYSIRSNGMWWRDVKLIKHEIDFVDADGKTGAGDFDGRVRNDDEVAF